MPLSPPKIVVPLTACTDRVRLQGQKTGSTVRIYASPNNIFDKVCDAPADGPDQTFVLTRRLVAGEHVYATQTVPGDASGSNVNPELVQPEPALSEIGPITADTHLHACARCAAFGNGYPGAEVRIVSASQGSLGTAVVDPDTGAARVAFTAALHQNESLSGSQSICGKTGPVRALPAPDLPASTQRRLPAALDRRECSPHSPCHGGPERQRFPGARPRRLRAAGEYAVGAIGFAAARNFRRHGFAESPADPRSGESRAVGRRKPGAEECGGWGTHLVARFRTRAAHGRGHDATDGA